MSMQDEILEAIEHYAATIGTDEIKTSAFELIPSIQSPLNLLAYCGVVLAMDLKIDMLKDTYRIDVLENAYKNDLNSYLEILEEALYPRMTAYEFQYHRLECDNTIEKLAHITVLTAIRKSIAEYYLPEQIVEMLDKLKEHHQQRREKMATDKIINAFEQTNNEFKDSVTNGAKQAAALKVHKVLKKHVVELLKNSGVSTEFIESTIGNLLVSAIMNYAAIAAYNMRGSETTRIIAECGKRAMVGNTAEGLEPIMAMGETLLQRVVNEVGEPTLNLLKENTEEEEVKKVKKMKKKKS